VCCNPFIRKFTKTSEVVFPLIYLFASSERRFMSLEVQNRPISGTGPLIGSVVSSQASFLLYNICSLVKAHTCCLH